MVFVENENEEWLWIKFINLTKVEWSYIKDKGPSLTIIFISSQFMMATTLTPLTNVHRLETNDEVKW